MIINLAFNKTHLYPNLEIPDDLYEIHYIRRKLFLVQTAKLILDNLNERNDLEVSTIHIFNAVIDYSIKQYELLEKYEECRVLKDIKTVIDFENRGEFNRIISEKQNS